MAPKREASPGDGVPLAAGRADRGVHWGAALSIAFAALAALGWGPSGAARGLAGGDPAARSTRWPTERRIVPERLADAVPATVVVPAVADAPRGEAVEPSAASVRPMSAPAPVAVADKPRRAFLEGAPGKTAAGDRRPRRPGRLQWRRCAPADPHPVRLEPLSRSRWPDPGRVPGSSACRRGAAAAHGLARVTRPRAPMRPPRRCPDSRRRRTSARRRPVDVVRQPQRNLREHRQQHQREHHRTDERQDLDRVGDSIGTFKTCELMNII